MRMSYLHGHVITKVGVKIKVIIVKRMFSQSGQILLFT